MGGAQDEQELLDSLLLDSELAAEDDESLDSEEELLGASEAELILDWEPADVLLAGGEPLPPEPALD